MYLVCAYKYRYLILFASGFIILWLSYLVYIQGSTTTEKRADADSAKSQAAVLVPETGSSRSSSADSGMAHGIDVSHYQPKIAWPAVHKSDIHFAYAKATGGTRFVDPEFEVHWEGMRQARMLRGAYHFFHADEDPVKQAKHYLKTVQKLADSDMPPMLDVEVRENVKWQKLAIGVRQWIAHVEQQFKRRPIIYAPKAFHESHLDLELKKYPVWIAEYRVDKPSIRHWDFWQYSDTGSIAGYNGNVDRSVFNGTIDKLRAFIRDSRLADGRVSE